MRQKRLPEIRKEVNDLLMLANIAYDVRGFEDPWQFHKVSFRLNFELYQEQLHGFHSEFYRHHHGAYSWELERLKVALENSGFLLHLPGRYASVSDAGRDLLPVINESAGFERSPHRDILKRVEDQVQDRSGRDLKAEQYALEVKGKTIADYDETRNEVILTAGDFADRSSVVEGLDDQAIMELYARFMFPATHGRPLEFVEADIDDLIAVD